MPCRPRSIPRGTALFVLPGATAGLIRPGNIDLFRRPFAQNGRSVSTVLSTDLEEDGHTVLIAQVLPLTPARTGRVVSRERAIREYHATGKHLGWFRNWRVAEAYAERLHRQQARIYCLW